MIDRIPFGRTGHQSTRVLFGAAALAAMRQERADATLDLVLGFGVNHIDTASGYGDSELRLAPFLAEHRDEVFLATKARERTREGAAAELDRSLERLGVESVDLWQLHNLVEADEWETALGAGGALEAAREARDAGKVRFIGVTGHGTRAPEMHLRSLDRFDFDSVLAPYSYSMMQSPEYAADFEALVARCREAGVAVQTIKSVARRRWQGEGERRFSWYEPLRDPDAIARSVGFVLSREGVFLNTSSDATLLQTILEAARDHAGGPSEADLAADVARFGIEPLFVRDVSDRI